MVFQTMFEYWRAVLYEFGGLTWFGEIGVFCNLIMHDMASNLITLSSMNDSHFLPVWLDQYHWSKILDVFAQEASRLSRFAAWVEALSGSIASSKHPVSFRGFGTWEVREATHRQVGAARWWYHLWRLPGHSNWWWALFVQNVFAMVMGM